MITRFLPLSVLMLSACGGIGTLVGGGNTAAELPSPMLATAHCVDAMADETGRSRQQIVVMQAAVETQGITLLQIAGTDDVWTCETDSRSDVVRLDAAVTTLA